MTELPLGVYGLRITGPDVGDARSSFVVVDEHAPEVRVDVVRATSATSCEHAEDARIVLAYRGGLRYEIDRDPAALRLHLPEPLNAHALVHPMLTIVASAQSRWLGRLALHGGAFVVDGRAWCILADKNGGKSSALAGLARRGVPVMTDDLIVIDDGMVLAGPRSVDLRPEAAAQLQMGEDIGRVGNRVRQRVRLAPPPGRAPLAGFVVFRWAADGGTSCEPIRSVLRLRTLMTHDALPLMGPQGADVLFPALDAPMWSFARPLSWSRFESGLDDLLALTTSA